MPVANVGGVGDAIGPQEWFQSLPFVTRTWFGASVLITVATNFGVFSPMQMIFLWPAIYEKFELWRLATSFLFVGSFDFGTLIALYLLVQFSKQYEAGGPFNTGAGGGTADYAFAIIFAVVMILITYPVVSSFARVPPMFARNLIYFVLYIWSRRNPDANANIWGVPVKGLYLPFAYLALTVFMGNSYGDMCHGLAIGHLYYFLVDVVPQVQGKDLLVTPRFLIDYFGIGEYRPEEPRLARVPGNQDAPAAGQGGGGGGHAWGGGGQRLGRT